MHQNKFESVSVSGNLTTCSLVSLLRGSGNVDNLIAPYILTIDLYVYRPSTTSTTVILSLKHYNIDSANVNYFISNKDCINQPNET